MATARRDLEALSAAGIPVYPQACRGGGWQLLGGARIDLSGLTAPEARALFLLLGPASPAAPSARAALRKLLRALPGTFRADAEVAAEAVVVDPAGWGERTRGRPEVAVLADAVVARQVVEFDYAGRGGGPGRRRAEPWGWSTRTAPGTWWPAPRPDGAPSRSTGWVRPPSPGRSSRDRRTSTCRACGTRSSTSSSGAARWSRPRSWWPSGWCRCCASSSAGTARPTRSRATTDG